MLPDLSSDQLRILAEHPITAAVLRGLNVHGALRVRSLQLEHSGEGRQQILICVSGVSSEHAERWASERSDRFMLRLSIGASRLWFGLLDHGRALPPAYLRLEMPCAPLRYPTQHCCHLTLTLGNDPEQLHAWLVAE